MKLFAWTPIGCWCLAAWGDATSLIRIGDPWRWRPGDTEPSEPVQAWRETAFDDSSWREGSSGFALDYGGDEATLILASPAYPTLFLRRTFEVTEPEAVKWLTLRVDYSGGFVAYLNGLEIVRRGLPGEPGTWVPCTTPAASHPRGWVEHIDVSAFAGALRAGPNTLAVQWHQSSPSGYGLAFVPELLANFTRGPFLQVTGPGAYTLVWHTPVAADTKVEFGTTEALGESVVVPGLTTIHTATLSELPPDTRHYYRVVSSDGTNAAVSPVFGFRTLRETGPFRFTVMADVGEGNDAQYAVAKVVRDSRADLVLVPGDLVYPYFDANRLDFRFFSVYGPQMRTTPFFVVAGNHDVYLGGKPRFMEAFYMPTNSVDPAVHQAAGTWPEAYYSFDHGDAHFAGLYLPLMNEPWVLTHGSPQLAWLEADLAASSKPWKFLFLHHPVATSNGHRTDDYDANGTADPVDVARVLLPVAQRHGVQAIFSGHAHSYERFSPMLGVHAVVSGGGGGPLYGLQELDPSSAQFWCRYQCVTVELTEDTLQVEGVGSDGVPFDTFYIRRAPLPRRVYEAVWQTPEIESGPANDGDGNITGQRFEFAGPPIPAVAGEFSNLGRLRVSYDHEFLYLGMESVMIHPDNNVFLFLESPGLPGVSQLAGLGNGVADPDGEGVDGLDFLENLGFIGFTPSVACVLGDEFADHNRRSFLRTNHIAQPWGWPPAGLVRTNLQLDIGQGVFRLDPGFPELPGARFQQYNRSPQAGAVAGEQNADFLEIALPFASLNLTHNSHIRVGAVVGGPGFTPTAQGGVRQLDEGYLGYRLEGRGQGFVQLEGVEVQIGPDQDPDGDGLLTADEIARGTDPQREDTDGDGLPDGWEVRYQLSPLSSAGDDGAEGDPDRDGHSNRWEYLHATNPRVYGPVLKLGVELLPGGWLGLRFNLASGSRYRLEIADGLQAGFKPLPDALWPRIASGGDEMCLVKVDAGTWAQPAFYRLVFLPELRP